MDNKTVTIDPGVYCKNLTINSAAKVTLNPGVYVIRDGLLKINSNSLLQGSDVLLFFTGKESRLEVDSNSALKLAAPTSGTYADILIYQDRKTTSDFFILNSDANSSLQGTIYIPNSPLKLNSQSTMSPSAFLSIIVRRLELNSNSTLIIRNEDYASKQSVFRSNGAVLVQ